MLKAIRKVAARLATEDRDEDKIAHYSSCLLGLAADTHGAHVRLLLAKEPSIREAALGDIFEYDLFAAAIFTNCMPLVESLIDSQLCSKFNNLGNPRRNAIKAGRFEILQLFNSSKYRYRARVFDMLEEAAHEGELRMVEYLLEPDRNPFPRASMNERVLIMRSKRLLETPSIEIFAITFAEKEKWDPRPMLPKNWLNLITHAAYQGWAAMTEHLISLGAPVEPSDGLEWKTSPVHYACEQGHDDVITVLLDHGAQIHGKDLEMAVSHGYVSTVAILLERGANIHCEGAKECLYVAAKKGLLEMTRILLDAGMDVNRASPAPIIGAVESEHTDIFWMLIERGARLHDVEVAAEAVRRAEAAGLESMLSLLKSCISGSSRLRE